MLNDYNLFAFIEKLLVYCQTTVCCIFSPLFELFNNVCTSDLFTRAPAPSALGSQRSKGKIILLASS